ncbi:MAG: 4Fe-4S binding protein [Acidobacteria bacterium]|nr:4Fe-4S binding protein [Acidobacteriota bacterium]
MIIGLLVLLSTVLAGLVLWFFLVGERGKFLPSTGDFLRQSGFGLRALHGYVYGRWSRQYVRTLFSLTPSEPPSKGERWLADRYHGKVLTHDHARAIVQIEKSIPLQDLEQIVPFPVARNIILQAPADIVAFECVCRQNRPSHCLPTEVCMVIGRPMTDFVLEHQPGAARRLTQAEALELLQQEHERGHVHSAWFKDAMLNRFYAICNCCKCCCGGIASMVNRGVRMMAGSGYVAEINPELCAACGDCMDACPFLALSRNGEGTQRDWDRCMGCGVCQVKCSTGAISLMRDQRKGIPLDVRALA